ncbi:hypothetical protein [Aurantiacibacter gilvus]|uniref:Uncharacterized protein n=1 Tax=Aurantiacibacter gilvus TaxID=3139141 RepID=A0ABU9IAC7_9SPHN
MRVSRRGLLAGATGCAALAAVPVRAAPPGAPSARLVAGVGEVWGMTYWARDAVPALTRSTRRKQRQPDWRGPFA